MKDILGGILLVLIVGAGLFTIVTIIRFSIISPRRTRGGKNRLGDPKLSEVEAVCGFPLDKEWETFYREAPFIDKNDLTLIDPTQTPVKPWLISGFCPLTGKDTKEQRAISGVAGVPIAYDLSKGVYFITPNGEVRLKSPGKKGGELLVAADVATLRKFHAPELEVSEEELEEA